MTELCGKELSEAVEKAVELMDAGPRFDGRDTPDSQDLEEAADRLFGPAPEPHRGKNEMTPERRRKARKRLRERRERSREVDDEAVVDAYFRIFA